MPAKLNKAILEAAILGMEAQKQKLDERIREIRQMLDGGSTEGTAATTEAPKRKRKKFSAAARRRMREAQQRRWAKIRGESEPTRPGGAREAPKRKRKLSPAARRAISEATKRRWALARAAKA